MRQSGQNLAKRTVLRRHIFAVLQTVLLQITELARLVGAQVAIEGFFSSVFPHVSLEVAKLPSPVATHAALERLLLRVLPVVGLQIRKQQRRVLTSRTKVSAVHSEEANGVLRLQRRMLWKRLRIEWLEKVIVVILRRRPRHSFFHLGLKAGRKSQQFLHLQ